MNGSGIELAASWDLDAAVGGLFDVERLIIERLRETVTGLKTIDSSSLIAGSNSFTELLPAAFVEPGGGSVDATSGYDDLPLKQTWSVLLVVSHHRSKPGDTSSAGLAGPVAVQIIRALHGWSPGEYAEPLLFTDHLDPVSSVGWAMFELRFAWAFRL